MSYKNLNEDRKYEWKIWNFSLKLLLFIYVCVCKYLYYCDTVPQHLDMFSTLNRIEDEGKDGLYSGVLVYLL